MTASRYADAGVDIAAGNEAVRRIAGLAKRTHTSGVLNGIGGFGSLFQHDFSRYEDPLLVSGADGVGTKLKVAFAAGRHDTVGIDCVAMNVNDILCCGATPLFFLDYIGTGKLEPGIVEEIVKGVAEGCCQAGCALVGGETAELPGLYAAGEYDLAGFSVGVVDRKNLIDGSSIRPGDVLLGLLSSGLHSNGFTLARQVLEPLGYDQHHPALGSTVGGAMLEPTRIYVRPVLDLIAMFPGAVKGIAHITGGGLMENLPRVLPRGTAAKVMRGSWPMPAIFSLIEKMADIPEVEMFTTFNMGIGMVLAVESALAESCMGELAGRGVAVELMGGIVESDSEPQVDLSPKV